MKTNILLWLATGLIFVSLVGGTLYNDGSPGAKTGSPLDAGVNCTLCHTSEVQMVDWISSNIPESGWIKGETYTLYAEAEYENAVKFGFELTAEDAFDKVGQFEIGDNPDLTFTNNNTAVSHSYLNLASEGKTTWEMLWTAPNGNFGDITFYAAFNAADGDGGSSGDQIFISSKVIAQDTTSTDVARINQMNIKVFPNPVQQYLFIQSPDKIQNVEIYDLTGQKTTDYPEINAPETRLDLSNLESGMYVLKISTTKGESNKKIQIK